jgi:asparaginyl-tRNA synthetase
MAVKVLLPSADASRLIKGLESDERRVVFEVQTGVMRAMTDRLMDMGFKWALPVMLAKCTDPLWPDSAASIEKKIEFEIYGESVRTMQSMIIHKLVLASLGPERFFILSPNIRIESRERAKTGWHLYEFTQLEVEIAHGRIDDVFRLFEDLIKTSMIAIRDRLQKSGMLAERGLRVPETPFVVYRRGELEEQYGKSWEEAVSDKIVDPIWVTDLPREFYDYEDETTGAWRNFDLILPEGYGEVVSGAEREHNYAKILRKLERDGVRKEEFQFLLRLAKDGKLKPSAGAGLGIERFVAYICGVEHVAEVQPFPRVPGIVPEL